MKKVSLFITCLGESFYPRAGVAAVTLLEHLGCGVDFPGAQTCCGQPMHNNGFAPEARRLAERMIRVFAGCERIVTVSGSCAAMVRDIYPHLFDDSPTLRRDAEDLASRTFEISEFLADVLRADLRASGAFWPGRVTYHYSCHLRGIGVTDQAVKLLRQIGGLELMPLTHPEQCCGFGGTFATKFSQISGALVRDKAADILRTGAAAVVSSEPGCTMNIAGACRREGVRAAFLSLPEIIAESLGLMPRSFTPSVEVRA